jgi:hypothetical protein
VAGDMSARIWNKSLNFVLGTNVENAINRNGRKWVEFATENELRIINIFFKHEDVFNSHGVLEIAGH